MGCPCGAPYLTIEPSFDILALAQAAGATFTARATTYHVPILVDVLRKGIRHEGFSIIEVVTGCPTNYGRQNKMAAPAMMMEWQKDHGVMKAAWDKMDPAQREGKFPIGVLYERTDLKEYTKAYDDIISRAQSGKEAASA